MREATLPPIFAEYANRVHYVQQVARDGSEFSSTCPACGGSVHPDRSWPDRCRWFVDEKPLGWCRRCGSLFFPDGAKEAMSRPEFAEWRRREIERQEARRRSAERALEHLRSQRIWELYHEGMDERARRYWERRGIPRGWQAFWQFGWRPEWRFTQDDGSVSITPSATIPLFDANWECVNIKHRLITPPPNRAKYLYEVSGQPQPLFRCDPDAELTGHVIVIEGEIKAAVTFARMDDAGVTMVGLPGTNPGPEIIDALSQAERITLVMDPGAKEQANKLAGQLGMQRVRVLIPPAKIDDGIVAGQLDRNEIVALLRSAVPAKGV